MIKLRVGAISLSLVIAELLSGAVSYSFPDCTVAPLKGNGVCDTTKDASTRARAIIQLFTVDELISNTVNTSPGVPRLGLPPYQWWSEALHGVANSPGVTFAPSGNFSSATSFPQPIVLGAAFDDELVKSVADVISTEARAFNNFGLAGMSFFTPNINPFKDPRWGRGQETPGEDPFHIAQYVFNLIQGLQGGIDPKPYIKVIADCKHFAGYDLENWHGNDRKAFNAIITPQDLSEYYLPSFQSCVRDAKVSSVMCSYNSVNGVPSCANSYLLQDIMRDYWGFNDDGRWVTADCDAVDNIVSTHNYTTDYAQAVADALKAGTDVDCGDTYSLHLGDAFNQTLITRADLEKALERQYSSLVRLGYFDPQNLQPFRQLNWANVNTPAAQALAHQVALEGIVLLKNDGTLPFNKTIKNIAFIGPWANATTQMQGNYQGDAPFLVSPVQGAVNAGFNATYTFGTDISGHSTADFEAALAAAKAADAIVFAGGIDDTVESEHTDRLYITWPGLQLDLINRLAALGKPLVVMQFGGGQIDDTVLKADPRVNTILWAGYPGQSGGTALADIISGKAAPAGRLTTTQYPAEFTTQVGMTDMTLRPSSNNPGRTYKWYTGTPVFEFGHGLHFTTFALSWQNQPSTRYLTSTGLNNHTGKVNLDLNIFDTFNVVVKNTGNIDSDYVALLFLSGTGGPAPLPNKELVSYKRLHQIKAGGQAVVNLKVTLGSVARADAQGNFWVYPGSYNITVDTGVGVSLTHSFELVGDAVQISNFPQNPS